MTNIEPDNPFGELIATHPVSAPVFNENQPRFRPAIGEGLRERREEPIMAPEYTPAGITFQSPRQLHRFDYETRPFKGDLPAAVLTLSEILNTLSNSRATHWSFAGGFARDQYLGMPYNDFDVCASGIENIKHQLHRMNLLELGVRLDSEIPNDYFIDPYDFTKQRHAIHWLEADTPFAYAPSDFDFSINHIALKPDGLFHAPTVTWRDFDRKLIRKMSDRMSINLALRGIRFACKYGFSFTDEFNADILEVMKSPMDTVVLKNNAKKMIEDGVEEECLRVMKSYNFPHTDSCSNLLEYIQIQDNLILSGQGHRDPTPNVYF